MIRIPRGAAGLASRLNIRYNVLFDFPIALDVLAHPGHHRIHSGWTSEVLKKLTPAQKDSLRDFDTKLDSFLNLDQYLNLYGYPDGAPSSFKEFSSYLQSPENWNQNLRDDQRRTLTDFLVEVWESFIFPVVAEHQTTIEAQIDHGRSILESDGIKALFRQVNDRVSFQRNGEMRIQKWVEETFDIETLDEFALELSLFSFPHLVIADEHEKGKFSLTWDVPFRNETLGSDHIDRLSRKAFALSDPSRLRILLLLADKPMSQKDLGRLMGFAKSTISRHISILAEAGFIKPEDGERNVRLRIDPDAIGNLPQELSVLLKCSGDNLSQRGPLPSSR